MGKPFNAVQAAILKALAEAFFHDTEMRISADQVVENIQSQFGKMVGGKPAEVGWSLLLMGVLLGGPWFLAASPERRARRIDACLRRAKLNFMQDLARLRAVIYAGYYGHWQGHSEADNRDNPVLREIDFTLPADRPARPAGTPQLAPLPDSDLPDSAFVAPGDFPAEAEIIVVGSGAGGAVAAAALAAKGHEVLVVEAGPHVKTAGFTFQEADMTARLFIDGALQDSRDHDVVIFQGRLVGGSTMLNNGICLPLAAPGLTHPDAPDVLGTWRALGAPVERARLEQAYAAVKERLAVSVVPPRAGRHNGPHLLEGWSKHAAASADPRDRASPALWFTKNYGPHVGDTGCSYCGYCNTGCAYGRKRAMPQTFLKDLAVAGGRILADTAVQHIEWDREYDTGARRAAGVVVRDHAGRTRRIRARRGVVVAAGALASSRLLLASGIESAGTDISLNIACPVPALMPEGQMQRAWDEDQMATYVDHGDFLLESHFQPPMSMSVLMPGWFGEHARRMRDWNRVVSAGVLFPADRRGRLVRGKLRFKLTESDLALLRRGLAALTRVHFAQGAEIVYPALSRGIALPRPRDDADIDAFFARHLREADDVTLSSSHPHGGNGMNASPYLGVVDPECRVHGTSNVYVTDASVFPSCIRVNAQLTTMAMSHYAMALGEPFRGC